MTKAKISAVGIDLGTTCSVISVLDDAGRPLTLSNAEGDKVTPSVILFDGSDVVVGREALKALSTDMANVAECPKRHLGKRMFPKTIGGRQYPPEALEAWILNKLRTDAAAQVGEVQKAVITVPAYFDEVRRKATQDAGFMAGLEVMDIINEPTAAAVAFGYQEGFLKHDAAPHDRQRILVYDLGGGTFDVTVMEINGTDFVTLATDGDVQLGGRDWDQRLVDYVAEDFIRKFGIDPREEPNIFGKLWRQCEEAKHTLSTRAKAVIGCEYQGGTSRLEVTREAFHAMTHDLLERTSFTTRQTLDAAGLTWKEIDRVLLVGGSTRMPSVVSMIEQLSGKPADRSVSPDEAVAHGAALHAGLLLSKHAGKPPLFSIRNVNSHSLGIVATEPTTKRQRTAFLIPRNTPLPTAKQRIFKTQRAGQQSILVQIVEGESNAPEECSQVGRCSIRGLPKDLPAKSPIEVQFHYAENGRLSVSVRVDGDDRLQRYSLQRENSLSAEQLKSWRQYICQLPA